MPCSPRPCLVVPFVALLVLAPSFARAAPSSAPSLTVLASSGVQAVRAGTGLSGDLGVHWPWSHGLGLALTGRIGGVLPGGSQPEHAGHLLLGLLIGPSLSFGVGAGTGHVALQIQHIHHTTTEAWRSHPLANLAGDSSGSVRHRSGFEASTGLSWPTGVTLGGWRLVLDTTVAASLLPASEQMAWAVGARLGVGFSRVP